MKSPKSPTLSSLCIKIPPALHDAFKKESARRRLDALKRNCEATARWRKQDMITEALWEYCASRSIPVD